MADRRRNPDHWRPSLIDRFRARARGIEQERGAAVKTDEVAAIYSELLESLRTESKNTITELSIVADQKLRHAEGIARAICDRILKVPVEEGIPYLYLMDSILKNTGCEYAICFAARLCEVFCRTYTKANTSLQAFLRHLFLTWQPHFFSSMQFSFKENPGKPARSTHLSCGLHVNAKYLEACHQSEQPTMDPSQYARLPSTPGKNSLFQYGGKEGSTSQSRAPSQTPRVGLISLSPPPGEWFHYLKFLESVVDKACQPRYGHRFGFGTSIDQNDGSAKSPSNDVKQGYQLLIDAYSGNDTSREKLPKVQRLNAYQDCQWKFNISGASFVSNPRSEDSSNYAQLVLPQGLLPIPSWDTLSVPRWQPKE